MSIETLISFVIASSILSFVPGPDNLYVLTQSALNGPKAGIAITTGLCTGLILHTLAIAFGLSAVFIMNPVAFTLMKFLGAGYLLWLAWLAIKPASDAQARQPNSSKLSLTTLYRRGVIMNLVNPKVIIFFLAFLPQFTRPEQSSLFLQFMILGSIFILVAFSCFSLVSLMAGKIARWLNHSPGAQTLLNRLSALIFAALAIRLITTLN